MFIRDPFAETCREDAVPLVPWPWGLVLSPVEGADGFADSSAFGRFAYFDDLESEMTGFTLCRGVGRGPFSYLHGHRRLAQTHRVRKTVEALPEFFERIALREN